jgi:hypothetical protein
LKTISDFFTFSAPAEDEEVFAEDYDDQQDEKSRDGKQSSLPKFSNEDLNTDKVAFLVKH